MSTIYQVSRIVTQKEVGEIQIPQEYFLNKGDAIKAMSEFSKEIREDLKKRYLETLDVTYLEVKAPSYIINMVDCREEVEKGDELFVTSRSFFEWDNSGVCYTNRKDGFSIFTNIECVQNHLADKVMNRLQNLKSSSFAKDINIQYNVEKIILQ